MKPRNLRSIRKDVIQFLEYLVGGTVYFWSGYLVFAICYSGFGWDWLPAKLMADVVGWTLNYLVQRYWAFANKSLKKHEGRTAGRYALITLVNLLLDYLIIWGLKSIGVSPYVGFFISAGFFTAWNYLWYRFWVFFVRQRNNNPWERTV
jgi:putative flippase GtrA